MMSSVDRETTASDFWCDDRLECELCGKDQTCSERYGMVTCRTCSANFLPSTGAL